MGIRTDAFRLQKLNDSSEKPRHAALCWSRFFSVLDRNVFEITEKNQVISVRMSENIPPRLMNTVMASFNTTVQQLTELSQRPKCISKMTEMCQRQKKQDWCLTNSIRTRERRRCVYGNRKAWTTEGNFLPFGSDLCVCSCDIAPPPHRPLLPRCRPLNTNTPLLGFGLPTAV